MRVFRLEKLVDIAVNVLMIALLIYFIEPTRAHGETEAVLSDYDFSKVVIEYESNGYWIAWLQCDDNETSAYGKRGRDKNLGISYDLVTVAHAQTWPRFQILHIYSIDRHSFLREVFLATEIDSQTKIISEDRWKQKVLGVAPNFYNQTFQSGKSDCEKIPISK